MPESRTTNYELRTTKPKPRVALVCDWLVGTGGAERVVLELHKMFPDAPIYTSQYDSSPAVWHGQRWFSDADVRTGWLQKLPKSLRKFLPPLRALYFSRLDLSEYDLVISSSGAEAKGVITGPKTVHISYLNSPTHYYWSRYEDYLKNPGFGRLDPLARLGLRLLVGPLRRWDYKAAQRADYVISISNHIQAMIKKYYDRDSVVIHPPVEIERFKLPTTNYQLQPRRGFVTAGRQTPYKRFDLAVAALTELDQPLLVLGNGPDHKRLKRMAGRKVTFIKNPSDEDIAHYFKTSLAFIFPGLDDFGIVAVEAMAAGTPVIAYRAGGALDYVNTSSGLFFDKQTPESLAKAIQKFSKLSFSHAKVAAAAEKFSASNFRANLQHFLESLPKNDQRV